MARIFITGSSDGLGCMAAKLLINQGHQVVLHARNTERGKQALGKVPGAEMLDPFRKVKCQVVIDEQQLKEYSTQLAVAVGLALQRVQEVSDQSTSEPQRVAQ